MTHIVPMPGQKVIAEFQGDAFFKGDTYEIKSIYRTLDAKLVMGIVGKDGNEYKFKCRTDYFSFDKAAYKEQNRLAMSYLISMAILSDTSLYISKGGGGRETVNYEIRPIDWQSGRPTDKYESPCFAKNFKIVKSNQDRSAKPWKHTNFETIEIIGDIMAVSDWFLKTVKDDFQMLYVGDSWYQFTTKMVELYHQCLNEFPRLDNTFKSDSISNNWGQTVNIIKSGTTPIPTDILIVFNHLTILCQNETIKSNMDLLNVMEIVANMFRLIPSSHGSTYIAKVLTGSKSVKLTPAVELYYGVFSNINYRTIFNITDIINEFLFITKSIEEKTTDGPKPDYIGHHIVNDAIFNLYFNKL